MTCGKCGRVIVSDMPGEMLGNPCAWGVGRRDPAAVAYMAVWRDGSKATEGQKQAALVALIRADKWSGVADRI